MSAPLVTVIVPAWNAERYLAECLESILAQDHEPKDVLVVDDGSTDRTGEIALGFGARVRCERQENAGCNAARNRGLAIARGELVAHFDADDIMSPGALRERIEALLADPKLEACTGLVENFLSPDVSPEVAARVRVGTPLAGQVVNALVIRRAASDRVGPFETEEKTALQTHWWMRATDVGLVVRSLPRVVLRRRIHDANWSLKPDAMRAQLVALKAALDRRRQTPPGSA